MILYACFAIIFVGAVIAIWTVITDLRRPLDPFYRKGGRK
jgi:hypothetical protein